VKRNNDNKKGNTYMSQRSKTSDKAQTPEQEAKSAELVEVEKNELSTRSEQEGFLITPDDMDIPWMNIVQKTSSIEGETGDLVLDKVHRLAGAEEPIQVVPLPPKRAWKEDKPFDEGMGQIVFNEAAAHALAAESEYKVIDAAECPFLIPAPEGNDDAGTFPFPIAGKNYALGKIHVAKEGFRKVYQRLATFEQFNKPLGVHISHKTWEFQTRFTERGKYKYYTPEIVLKGEDVDGDLLEFLKTWGAA